ncbi:MAG TPA: hypothetical protein DCM62_02290 [Bacteroidales bacterium]|nr:hypothetical protein [Bacteroidales bacterium]
MNTFKETQEQHELFCRNFENCHTAQTYNAFTIKRATSLVYGKLILWIFFAFIANNAGHAQIYQNALGLRVGVASGISFKHFISKTDAIELMVGFHHQSIQIGGLFQRHAQAFDIAGMQWYYGGGGFLGFYDGRYHPSWNAPGRFTVLGAMGVVGLEYKIEDIPISIGLDITPAIDIIPLTLPWVGVNVVLRYVF